MFLISIIVIVIAIIVITFSTSPSENNISNEDEKLEKIIIFNMINKNK